MRIFGSALQLIARFWAAFGLAATVLIFLSAYFAIPEFSERLVEFWRLSYVVFGRILEWMLRFEIHPSLQFGIFHMIWLMLIVFGAYKNSNDTLLLTRFTSDVLPRWRESTGFWLARKVGAPKQVGTVFGTTLYVVIATILTMLILSGMFILLLILGYINHLYLDPNFVLMTPQSNLLTSIPGYRIAIALQLTVTTATILMIIMNKLSLTKLFRAFFDAAILTSLALIIGFGVSNYIS